MAKKTEGAAPEIIKAIFSKAFQFLGNGSLILDRVRNAAERRAEAVAARVGLRLLLQAWVSAGLFLAVLGIFELVISTAGIARGLVYALGGAMIAVLALFCLYLTSRSRASASDF